MAIVSSTAPAWHSCSIPEPEPHSRLHHTTSPGHLLVVAAASRQSWAPRPRDAAVCPEPPLAVRNAGRLPWCPSNSELVVAAVQMLSRTPGPWSTHLEPCRPWAGRQGLTSSGSVSLSQHSNSSTRRPRCLAICSDHVQVTTERGAGSTAERGQRG